MTSHRIVPWLLALGLLWTTAGVASAQWQPSGWQAEPAAFAPAEKSRVQGRSLLPPAAPWFVAVEARVSTGGLVALGAAVGAVVGALAFYTTGYPCTNDEMFCEFGFVSYGAAGALAGGFIGYISSIIR